jgi:hypothetical protein
LISPSPWAVFADLLDPPPNPYVRDPVGWVTSTLGEFWWSGQAPDGAIRGREPLQRLQGVARRFEVAHDVEAGALVDRRASTGRGFRSHHRSDDPTGRGDPLWRYMGNAHRKADLPGRITLDAKWYIGNELVAYGRKPADYDPAAFQGIHARYVLVIIDEAGGVPKSISDAVDALATNVDARVVAVGNPDDPASHFATICKPGSGWHVETISAFDTPAYTGEKVLEDLLPLLVSPEWVEERKLRWGVTSPIYQSKVLGEFPDISDHSLILPRWIEAAQKRTLQRTRRPIIAADIARFGEDETVIMRREGGWIRG